MAGRRVGYAAKTDYVKAGHQCSSFPGKGPEPGCYRGGPTNVGTQEALCVPILANGTTDFRVGHDNIISLDDDPVNEGGCIFNDQTNHGLPGRREFREFRAVPKAAGGALKWVITQAGYRVPPGALHTGSEYVAARTLTAATNAGNIIPGYVPVTGVSVLPVRTLRDRN